MDIDTPPIQARAATPPTSLADIRAAQNFPLAVIAGIGAAIAGAVLWAAVTVASHMQLGIVSIGVGLLIGYAIRETGKGIEYKFRYLGAACAVLGCALGALLVDVCLYAEAKHMPILDTFLHLNPDAIPLLMKLTFQPMDLLFYAIAIYEAFKVSRKWRLKAKAQ